MFVFVGLEMDLFYIREGEIKDYALKFVVPVPPKVDILHFTWQSLVEKPVSITSSSSS